MNHSNFHAHSSYSDGHGKPEEYILEAIQQDLIAYGFSDHAPIIHRDINLMPMEDLQEYLLEIDRLKTVYGDRIQIYKSLEVDYIPDLINVNSDYIRAANLDYTIGAVHFVDQLKNGTPWGYEESIKAFNQGVQQIFNGDIRACIERYYELIREMVVDFCPDIIAHLDRIKKLNFNNQFFSESEKWYRSAVNETLDCIADSSAIMEVNTKGYYKDDLEEMYPSTWIITQAYEMGIPLHLSSDAHHPEDITKGFDQGIKILKNIGIEETRIMLNDEWIDQPLEKDEWYLADLV